MRRWIVALLCVLAPAVAGAQTFQDFISRLYATPDSLRQALVDSFTTAVPRSPVIDRDTVCSYYWRGSAGTVTVPGDANGWSASAFPMARVPATDLWYYTRNFESDARLDYKYVTNGSTWILDPRNPNTVSGGYGPNSELRMPRHVPPPEIVYDPGIPHGALRDTTWYSYNLGNARVVRIYTPPGYSASQDSFPVVVFHDGLEYVTLAYANNVLDYLISRGRIRPVIGVFIPPVNRTAEYAGSQINQFTAFVANEIIPFMDAAYRTRRHPQWRATLGASNGGNIALWLGYARPDVFGNVAAHSSNVIDTIARGLQSRPLLPLRFYLDIGTYDIAVLIPLVRNLRGILQTKGYPHRYQELHDGHSWGNWRMHIDDALEYFFPGPAVGVGGDETAPGLPEGMRLEQNYPNPFNGATVIRFSVNRGEVQSAKRVRLAVYDLLGREVAVLMDGVVGSGVHAVEFRAEGLSSGVYLYRLTAGGNVITRKLAYIR
jgi:enterochelin esterase family protein